MSHHYDLFNGNTPETVFKLWKKEGSECMSRTPPFAMNILERYVCYIILDSSISRTLIAQARPP